MSKTKSKNKKDVEHDKIEAHELITPNEVEQIRKSLIETHADLVVQGMLDADVRKQLEKIVARDYQMVTKNNPDVVRYIVRETIGTGVIEEILNDENITDIGYNGSELIIETNDKKTRFDTNFEITDEYIVRLVNKFANANNRDFTSKNPIFDGRFENVRINAVHAQNTAPDSGTTMSLRVVRPRLALTNDNFSLFAPMFMLDFLKAAVLSHSNMVISGTTGTGKTELHKLISSFIPFNDRIILIEDTPETFMKEMFPDKDIYSWVTNEDVSVTDMIKAGLRNHPVWMMVTETRGSEAYEMIQTVLSGHSIITSLHSKNARAIPSRFVNMSKMGYTVDEQSLIEDIRMYFDFGIHIKKVNYNGMVVRYLSEVIEFNPSGDVTVFKQRFVNGVFYFETTELPGKFIERLEESMIDINDINFPAYIKSERLLNPDDVTSFVATIPLDKTGRPDIEKIEASGKSLDDLIGFNKYMAEKAERDRVDNIQQNEQQYAEQRQYDSHGVTTPKTDVVVVPQSQAHDQSKDHLSNDQDEIMTKVDTIKSKMTDVSLDDNTVTEIERPENLDEDVQRILDTVVKDDAEKTKPPIVPPKYRAPRKTIAKPKKDQEVDENTGPSVDDIIEAKRRKLLEDE